MTFKALDLGFVVSDFSLQIDKLFDQVTAARQDAASSTTRHLRDSLRGERARTRLGVLEDARKVVAIFRLDRVRKLHLTK